MEKLLYQKVFEKGVGIKSANTLGQLANFLAEDITGKKKYPVISSKTLKRGFQEYLEQEIVEKFKWPFKKNEFEIKYIPGLETLNILSIYMSYESFSDFCQKNKVEEKEVEQPKQKNNITVYQENNGKVFGDVNVKESIIFNLKK